MKNKIIVFFILSFIYILLFPTFKERVLEKDYFIEFRTNGEKCDASLGTEIWIDAIVVDGALYDLATIDLGESNWEHVGRIFNSGEEAAVLNIKVPYKKTLEIIFVTHPYSGIIEVTNQKQTKEINLYSSDQGTVSCIFER